MGRQLLQPKIPLSNSTLAMLALAAALGQGCSAISGSVTPVEKATAPRVIIPESDTSVMTPTKPAFPVSTGQASWYGPGFSGKKTASGDIFDDSKLTAAHKTLPFRSKAKVTNLSNGKSVKVEINDRGPYVENRIIDLSRAAAHALGMIDHGVVPVKIEPAIDESGVVAGNVD